MKDKFVHGLMLVGMFLLRGAGWAAIGIFVGFLTSYFVRLPGRVDTFALTESLLGVVITGLSIGAAFAVAFQWSNLDSRMHAFDAKVKETNEFFDKASERAGKIATDIDEYVKSTVDGYKEKVDYLDKLLEENAKTAEVVNDKIDEYKKFYEELFTKSQVRFEEKEKELEVRQKELNGILEECRKLSEKQKSSDKIPSS